MEREGGRGVMRGSEMATGGAPAGERPAVEDKHDWGAEPLGHLGGGAVVALAIAAVEEAHDALDDGDVGVGSGIHYECDVVVSATTRRERIGQGGLYARGRKCVGAAVFPRRKGACRGSEEGESSLRVLHFPQPRACRVTSCRDYRKPCQLHIRGTVDRRNLHIAARRCFLKKMHSA